MNRTSLFQNKLLLSDQVMDVFSRAYMFHYFQRISHYRNNSRRTSYKNFFLNYPLDMALGLSPYHYVCLHILVLRYFEQSIIKDMSNHFLKFPYCLWTKPCYVITPKFGESPPPPNQGKCLRKSEFVETDTCINSSFL